MADPLPGNRQPGWYYRLGGFFRRHFGTPAYKIPVNAGFSCPNRDAATGKSGCSYCYNPAFAPQAETVPGTVTAQIERGKKGGRGGPYLAYFQAYTNTYGPLSRLKSLYEEALQVPGIAGLSIATRPDCISEAALELLEGYARAGRHIWVEYGLQSSHDTTLERINRGHTYHCFREAVAMTRGRGIFTCAHVIIGLPGESPEMILETMRRLNECGVDGVKFHHLQVIRGTPLAEQYFAGEAPVFENATDYIPLLCDCLETLLPSITIHRLAARVADDKLLIAPHWPQSATQLAAAVEYELRRRGRWQGSGTT